MDRDLVKEIALQCEVTQKTASEIILRVFSAVLDEVVDKGKLKIPEFGTFLVKDRKARKGRNPRTQEAIDIPARKAVVFKPAKDFSDAVK
jgi:DNA-binding protein HU-beta